MKRFIDGDGGRTKKVVYGSSSGGSGGGAPAQLAFAQLVPVETKYVGSLFETNGTGTNNTKYIFLGGTRVASVTTTGAVSKTLFYHGDHLGGTNVLTDSSGVKKELIEYEPFGLFSRHEKYGSSVEVANFYFTGKPLDDETGLYYFGARYYDPTVGRFISPDTIVQDPGGNPQTLNRYSYCGNNPVNHIDPTGHSWWKKFWKPIVTIAVGIIVGVLTAGIGTAFYAGALGTFWGGIASAATTGFIAGAVSGGLGAGLNGQSIFQGALMGGAYGALSGAAFGAIGKFGGKDWNWKVGLERVGLSAVAGGGISEIAGGSFEDGAMFAGAFAGADFLYNGVMNASPETKGQRATMATADESGQPRLDQPKEALRVNGHSKNSNTAGLAEKSGAKGFIHNVAGETGPVMNFLGKNVPGFQGMSRFHDNITTGFRQLLGGGGVGGTANGLLFNFQSMAPSYAINAMGAVMNSYPAVSGQFVTYGEGSN